jgi:hypothetical protein
MINTNKRVKKERDWNIIPNSQNTIRSKLKHINEGISILYCKLDQGVRAIKTAPKKLKPLRLDQINRMIKHTEIFLSLLKDFRSQLQEPKQKTLPQEHNASELNVNNTEEKKNET